MSEINKAAQDLLELKKMKEELEAEIEALTDLIKGAMVDRGEEVITGDGWKASWKNVTSSRFDSLAFRKAEPDLYKSYSKQTTTCRFLISAT